MCSLWGKTIHIYNFWITWGFGVTQYTFLPGADKSLARPGSKQARKHVRDARDFNNIEVRAVIKFFFFLQGEAPKEIHAILRETFACFLPGPDKDLSALLYSVPRASKAFKAIKRRNRTTCQYHRMSNSTPKHQRFNETCLRGSAFSFIFTFSVFLCLASSTYSL